MSADLPVVRSKIPGGLYQRDEPSAHKPAAADGAGTRLCADPIRACQGDLGFLAAFERHAEGGVMPHIVNGDDIWDD
jgi:hypothetical protein